MMRTIFSCRCLVVLVYAHLCWKLSEGAVFPCSKKDTQFENLTLEAGMGGRVSFKFCAENSVRVFERINISHPNHRHGWYPKPVGVEERLQVQVTIHYRQHSHSIQTRVTVTVTKLQPTDFNGTFSVTLFAADENGTRINDSSTFFFVIKETASSVSTRPTDHPVKPASGSTSIIPQATRLSTLSTQATTDFSIPATSISQCLRDTTSTCPQNWYQVDNDTCLIVVNGLSYYAPPPSNVCDEHYGIPVLYLLRGGDSITTKKVTECLKYILEQSVPTPFNYVVRLDTHTYVNIQSGAMPLINLYKEYHVACYQKKEFFKSPTVSSFSLHIYTNKGWKFVDNDTDYVTVQTAYANVFLKCHAEGTPQPLVIITDESLHQFTSGTIMRLAVCRRAVFTCTTSNSVGSSQVHRRILLLRPLKVTQFIATVNNSRQEIRIGDTVELRCVVDGCPDNITITRNAHPIAKTANYTSHLVHEIQKFNCLHMGTYTCLAKSRSGQGDQKTASLEVRGYCTHTLVGQTAQQHKTDSRVLLIALPPVCYIILVFIISGIVWHRVKGTRISRRRSEDIIDCGSGNDNSRKVMYANLREALDRRMAEQQEQAQQQEAGRLHRQEDCTTTDRHDKV